MSALRVGLILNGNRGISAETSKAVDEKRGLIVLHAKRSLLKLEILPVNSKQCKSTLSAVDMKCKFNALNSMASQVNLCCLVSQVTIKFRNST